MRNIPANMITAGNAPAPYVYLDGHKTNNEKKTFRVSVRNYVFATSGRGAEHEEGRVVGASRCDLKARNR